MALVLGPKSERLDLRLSGPGLNWADWFTVLTQRGVRSMTTDDDPVYGLALRASGLDRQQCAVHLQHTVGRHIRAIDDDLTHLERILLPILRRLDRERPLKAGPILLVLWEAVRQGRVRLQPEGPAVAPRGTLVRLSAQPREPQGARLHQPARGLIGCPLGALQAPGPPDAGAEDRNRCPQLRAPDGSQHGLRSAHRTYSRTACRGQPATNINEIETVLRRRTAA